MGGSSGYYWTSEVVRSQPRRRTSWYQHWWTGLLVSTLLAVACTPINGAKATADTRVVVLVTGPDSADHDAVEIGVGDLYLAFWRVIDAGDRSGRDALVEQAPQQSLDVRCAQPDQRRRRDPRIHG